MTQQDRGCYSPGSRASVQQVSLWLGMIVILGLFLLIAFSPHHLVYDERDGNLTNVEELHRVGWIKMLTSPSSLSAAGPLYTAIHAGLAGLTKLSAPAIRFPNFVLLMGVMFILGATAKSLRLENSTMMAGSILGVPFLWASVGMALTELPALFCFTGGAWACVQLDREMEEKCWRKCMGIALTAGVLLGLACLGRQTYLVTLVPLVVFLRRDPGSWVPPAVIALAAVAVCGWLFVVWGGLVPPQIKSVHPQPKWSHGMLSFGYIAVVTLIVAPRWLICGVGTARGWNIASYAITLISMAVAILFPTVEIAPARSLAERVMPAFLFAWYPRVIPAILAGLAGLWLMRFAREIWLLRQERSWLYICLALLLLAITPIKITHQFSSRYVVTGIGLLVLILWKQDQTMSWSRLARLGLGAALGSLILLSYYSQ